MSSDSGTVDKEVGSQAKGYLQVWFNPHDGQVFNRAKKTKISKYVRNIQNIMSKLEVNRQRE